MRVAIYHNLPSGGAKRALFEYIKNTAAEVEYDLYRIDDPINEDFLDLRPLVNQVYSYPPNDITIPRYLKGVRMIEPFLRLRRLVALQQKIAQDIDAKGYDLVFVHHCRITQSPALLSFLTTPSLYFMQEPRRIGYEYLFKPTFAQITGPASWLRQTQQKRLEKQTALVDAKAERAATLVLANSYYSRESILRAYGTDSIVEYLGIDAKDFALGSKKRDKAVISVGALHPIKGHDFIITALATIPEADRPKLRIVYDRALDGFDETLRKLAKRNQVELELFHNVSQAKLVELYQSSSVTACAAQLEPFGFTPLEAMSCGTPVVDVEEAGYRETVVDQVNGLLVDKDAAAFGAAVHSITQGHNRFEPTTLRKYVTDNWSWEKSVASLLKLYQRTTEQPS